MNENVDDVADEYSRAEGKIHDYRGNGTFRARDVSSKTRLKTQTIRPRTFHPTIIINDDSHSFIGTFSVLDYFNILFILQLNSEFRNLKL